MLISFSRPWPDVSLLDFLDQGSGSARIYWANERYPLAFAGIGAAAQLQAAGTDRFEEIRRQAESLFAGMLHFGPDRPAEIAARLFGGFAFQQDSGDGSYWKSFPAASFILPRYQLTRSCEHTWLTITRPLSEGQEPLAAVRLLAEEAQDLRWQGADQRFTSPMVDAPDWPARAATGQVRQLMTHDEWVRIVEKAIQRIKSGDLDKVVLARAIEISASGEMRIPDVLARLGARYPDCFRFLYEPVPGHAFMGATPELLAEVEGKQLQTHALAGSIQRGRTWQEDQALGESLMNSRKDRHEHELVVQALRANLRSLTSELTMPAEPQLMQLNNIQHLMTPVQARLLNGSGILRVVRVLHPTPALAGLPRPAALSFIRKAEPQPRGWYGGPLGWLGPDRTGQLAVGIRSAVLQPSGARLYAGAGIVADSDPQKEWIETEIKFRPLLEALGG